MANHEHVQETCPSCGGNEIEADRRYGKKLKDKETIRQTVRDPIFWIGLALVSLPAWFAAYTGQAWRYGLEVLGFVLVVFTTVRVYRALNGPGATLQFPETKYTCSHCGHQWTSEELRTEVAQGTVGQETADKVKPQQAKTDI